MMVRVNHMLRVAEVPRIAVYLRPGGCEQAHMRPVFEEGVRELNVHVQF